MAGGDQRGPPRRSDVPADHGGRFDYPNGIRAELQRLSDASLSLLDHDPAAAKDLAREQLALIERAEQATGRRLHKGQPLHNIAIAETLRSVEAARIWFLAAYIEDARSSRGGVGDTPARLVLRVVYRYSLASLRALEQRARRSDASPFELAMLVSSEGAVDPAVLPFPEHGDEAALARVSKARRVFVGGSYKHGWPTLITIARGVVRAGFTPVIVKTFPDRRGEGNRAKSFRLLGQCGAAVFDGSFPVEGWEQELSEIAKNPIPTNIFFGADSHSRRPTWSTMLPGEDDIPGLRATPFVANEELEADVARWLTEEVSRPSPPAADVEPLVDAASFAELTQGGSVTRFAAGSNARYQPQPGSAVPYVGEEAYAVPSGGGYFPNDPAAEAVRISEYGAEVIKRGGVREFRPTKADWTDLDRPSPPGDLPSPDGNVEEPPG
jgi:hypothetical protein